jgi:hypothetical protein
LNIPTICELFSASYLLVGAGLAHHYAMRMGQAQRNEKQTRVYLSARTRHDDLGSYPPPEFSNRSTGAKAAVPEVRITTGGRYLEVSKHPMANAG